MVAALIDRKASVSATDKYGSTALHLACEAGHADIAKVSLQLHFIIRRNINDLF